MSNREDKKGIVDFLRQHMEKKTVAFHMPGHKGAAFYEEFGYGGFLAALADADITEIPGADNLFQAEDVILATMKKYERLYGAKKSYLLVNGTIGGILASILSTVPKGRKLIMARNCHKSVFNALALAHAEPVYVYPELISEYGISGAVPPDEIKRLLEQNPEAEAVILPSPNYYGICSDISAIAEAVHQAGKILIVDQAHGAHLKFFAEENTAMIKTCSHSDCTGSPAVKKAVKLPRPAEEQGADITINSIHKTLGSFTQSAVLNVNTDRIDLDALEDKLQMIESSSPSYLLMASLDMNAEIILQHGKELFARWQENLEFFYKEAEKISGLKIMRPKSSEMDSTKLNLDMSRLALSGDMLEEALMKKGIYCELVTGNILMCMSGIGNTREDYERLLLALREVANDNNEKLFIADKRYKGKCPDFGPLEFCRIPVEKVRVKIDDAAGRICAASIIPYPPGIPIACPGERITEELAVYVKKLRERGEKVIGVTENGEITVGK